MYCLRILPVYCLQVLLVRNEMDEVGVDLLVDVHGEGEGGADSA
jgi:hypothetical protein